MKYKYSVYIPSAEDTLKAIRADLLAGNTMHAMALCERYFFCFQTQDAVDGAIDHYRHWIKDNVDETELRFTTIS